MPVDAAVSARGADSPAQLVVALGIAVVLVGVTYVAVRFTARRRLARSMAAGQFLMDGSVDFDCFPEPWLGVARGTVPLWARHHRGTTGLIMRAEVSGDALTLRKRSRLQGRRPLDARLRLEDIRAVEVTDAHSTPLGNALLIHPATGPALYLDTVLSREELEVLAAQLRGMLPGPPAGRGGLRVTSHSRASDVTAG